MRRARGQCRHTQDSVAHRDFFHLDGAGAAQLPQSRLDSVERAEQRQGGELARTLVTHPSVDSTASTISAYRSATSSTPIRQLLSEPIMPASQPLQ